MDIPNTQSPLPPDTNEVSSTFDFLKAQKDAIIARQRDWVPLAKALFEIEHDPRVKEQAWFDFQGKAQRLIAIMSRHS